MKRLIAATMIALGGLGLSAHAAESSCDSQAADKHLAGAAKTSFVAKCERTRKAAANEQCSSQADDKKLHGAARTSFVKKCVADASK